MPALRACRTLARRPAGAYTPGVILAIDTCLPACSVALTDGEAVWSHREVIGTGHAERVAPMVAALFEAAGAAPAALSRLVCTVGPGSFMGARVGISLAKGLALPASVPCVPITTTEAIALGRPLPLTVLIDARRGQTYTQRFGEGATDLALLPYAEAATLAEGGPVAGVGTQAVTGHAAPDDYPDPRAMLAYGGPQGRLSPLYLRAPDAKPGRPPL